MADAASPFYNKEDEHVILLIKQNQRLCQQTMTPQIEKAQKTAERGHARIDEVAARVNRLDDKEMGKVTVLWRDRRMLLAVIGIVVLNLVLQFVRIGSGGTPAPQNFSKDDIKVIVKTAIVDSIRDIKGTIE